MDTNQKRLMGVIGAGVSNMTFLHYFKNAAKYNISLFERSKFTSGRVATRRAEGLIYDNGANYIYTHHKEIEDLITKELDSSELTTIKKYVIQFDKNNNINKNFEEAKEHNLPTKYSYKQGLRTIGKMLQQKIQDKCHLIFNTDIKKIVQRGKYSYELFTEKDSLGTFDSLVFGIPSMNLLELFRNSELFPGEEQLYQQICDSISLSKYKLIYSLAVAIQPKIDFDFYALVNIDRQHEISWLSIENDKEGHVLLDNTTLMIVQMGNDFSTKAFDEKIEEEEIKQRIMKHVEQLLPQVKSNKVVFSDLKRWKYALPTKAIDPSIVEELAKRNIYLNGDCLLDRGRVDEAMMTGIRLAQRFETAKF